MKRVFACLLAFWALTLLTAQAAKVPEEAKKHMAYGAQALEMAQDNKGYQKAADEFEAAAKLAPKWPAPYYNLGLIYSKMDRCDDALSNYKKYLELSPRAKDAEQVKAEIYKLEYKKKQQSDLSEFYGKYYQTYGEDSVDRSLERQWTLFFDQSGPQSYYMLFVNNRDGSRLWNDHVTFTADDKGLPRNYDAWFDYSPDAKMVKAFEIEVKGDLNRPGDPTYGIRDREGKDWIEAMWDCKPQRCYYWFLPENKTWRWSGKPSTAPPPTAPPSFGGVGMDLTFKDGSPKVQGLVQGAPAQKAGIQVGDVIVEIDGEKTKTMSSDQVAGHLRGTEGTTVVVTLRRAGRKAPLKIKLVRETIQAP